jgi:hypothetical protein
MGSKASCSISDATVHPFELKLIQRYSNRIAAWHRFRDDIFMIWTGSETELKLFIEETNRMHPTLKFTFEYSTQEVNFLDITIFKGKNFLSKGILDTKVYTKPTDTFMYLEPSSAHPHHVYMGLIKGETTRYIRNCSHYMDFKTKLDHFLKHMAKRGHNPVRIKKATSTVQHKHRQKMLHSTYQTTSKGLPTSTIKYKAQPPLTISTTFDPGLKHLKQAFLAHWRIIQNNINLSNLFPEPPIVAYKRGRNISDIIIRSRLSPTKHLKT